MGRAGDSHTNHADFVALTETNFEILTSEVFQREPTYVSGVPTTIIGPSTSGTWKQILPAAVTADPVTGTIPTGYLIFNVTQGTLKRHAGGYSWETIVGATGGKIGFYGVTLITQPAGAAQAAVTLGNTDGEIAGLTISDPPTQAEVQALRDKAEELADDVRALAALVHALRTALVAEGLIKGGA